MQGNDLYTLTVAASKIDILDKKLPGRRVRIDSSDQVDYNVSSLPCGVPANQEQP